MNKKYLRFIFILLLPFLGVNCRRDLPVMDGSGYPKRIAKIILTQCVVPGCHTEASREGAGGLCLSTWDKLFEGGMNNSSVIPFRPDQSFFFFAINTFPDLGPCLNPPMPAGRSSLDRQDVILIRDWIAAGAPSESGQVKFSGNPGRKKLYVANQGCDLVTVFDLETKLVMRCIDVGNSPSTESPHDIQVSPDGQNWYVSFFANGVFQKYSASGDVKTGEIDLSDPSWHSMTISPDSKYAVISHLASDGKVALVSLSDMKLVAKYSGSGLFVYPHGCAFNKSSLIFYTVSLLGNFVYKTDISNPADPVISQVPLQPGEVPSPYGQEKPYEVDFTPDFSRYVVTCQGTLDVRIFDAGTDSLMQSIPATGIPQTMAFSADNHYVFVTNMEDSSLAGTRSSVDIIDLKTMSKAFTVFPGYQPRGLAVDDDHRVVYIADRNVTPAGPQPHHTTACKGKSGYITMLDMNTMQMISTWRTEVSVDPYSMAIRK